MPLSANPSSVMGRPAETRAMLWMISQLDWTIAKTLVKVLRFASIID